VTDGLIQVGEEYAVSPLSSAADALVIRCLNVAQRNWSRVGSGEYTDTEGQSQRCFIKQYVDKAGVSHSDHWDFEKDGALMAAELLAGVARVPGLIFRSENQLLNVFEYVDIFSLDVLLRTDAAAFDRSILSVVQQMAHVLHALQNPPATYDLSPLKVKQRAYGTASTAINFKGFEIRNAGVPVGLDVRKGSDDVVLFDFVRPYLAPVEEAAAKLFVSIGLLNWGSPLTRFIKGPDKDLLDAARKILLPWLDNSAIAAELDLQEKFRTGEFKGSGGFEVFLKRVGVDMLGKIYFRQLRSWCKKALR
jgi:hypothetical protein